MRPVASAESRSNIIALMTSRLTSAPILLRMRANSGRAAASFAILRDAAASAPKPVMPYAGTGLFASG